MAAAMAVVTQRVHDSTRAPLGVSMLSNAAECSIAAAWAGGAGFVRVNQWADNIGQLLPACHGVIVASSVKDNGRWWGRVDTAKVRRLTAAASAGRAEVP
jgi:predicted TIM-barrel enzyme